MQVIWIAIKKENIPNPLEDLLTLNICADNFVWGYVIAEGFKIKWSRTK